MALEWLHGGTLEDRLKQGPLPPDETHRVAVGIAAGLAHLHARGLVHRDLKPANVLFDEEGRPKLGDFGLARRTAGAGTLTEAGTVLGTAAYISPEQAAGEPAGAASDVYSFGVILFRMLTGALPFTADNALALVDMHRNAPPPAVETLEPDAPPQLAALAAAALRKDPAQRPADGSALLAALGEPPTTVAPLADTAVTREISIPDEPPAARRRWPAAAIAAALVILAAGGGVLAWAVTRSGSSPGSPTSTGSATHRHTATTHGTTLRTTSTAHPTTTAKETTSHTTSPTTTRRPPPTTTQPAPPSTTLPTTVPPTTAPTTLPPTTTAALTTTTAVP
jgi:serine/threonine-protein kinase